MALFVIADLHLDTVSNEKSMEVFGKRWTDYVNKIEKNFGNNFIIMYAFMHTSGKCIWGNADKRFRYSGQCT